MKWFFSVVILFTFNFGHAVTLEVLGKNGEALFSGEMIIEKESNVGMITTGLFDQNQIEYDGSELGIREMFDLTNELDIISKQRSKHHM